MRHQTLVLCALVAIPCSSATTAWAQRGGGRGGGGRGGGDGAGLGASPEAMAKLREQMQALAAIGLKLQERRTADVVESLASLTPEQLIKAREFLGEQDQEFDRILPCGRGGPPG